MPLSNIFVPHFIYHVIYPLIVSAQLLANMMPVVVNFGAAAVRTAESKAVENAVASIADICVDFG
jgi:hypothetical protein